MTPEEIAELERRHISQTVGKHTVCAECTSRSPWGVLWPCVILRLLAERREREAKLVEARERIKTLEVQVRLREASPAPFHEDHCYYADRAEEAEAKLADAERAEKNEHRQRMRAEAKLAAIKKLTQMFDGAVPTWRLREALADPPRTSAPTTGETK